MVWQRRERGGTFGNYGQGGGYNPTGFGFGFDPGMPTSPMFMPAPQAPLAPQVPQFQWNKGQPMFGAGSQQFGFGAAPGGQSSWQGMQGRPAQTWLQELASSDDGSSAVPTTTPLGAVAGGGGTPGGNQGGPSWTNSSLPWWELGMKGLIGASQIGLGFAGLNEARIQGRASRSLASRNFRASVQAYNNALRDRIEGRGGLTREAIDREYQQKRQK